MTVLDRGAEPRTVLRVKAGIGDSRAFEAAIDLELATLAGGEPNTAHVPTVRVFGRETVARLTGDELLVRAEVTATRPEQRTELMPEAATGAREIRLSVRGALRTRVPDGLIAGPKGGPQMLPPAALLDEPAFPASAVGVGARWTSGFTRLVDGDPMVMKAEWTLVELSGDRFVIEGVTRLAAPLVFDEGEISTLETRSRTEGSLRFAGRSRIVSEGTSTGRIALRDVGGAPVETFSKLRLVISNPPEHEPDAVPGPGPDVVARRAACTAEADSLRAWAARFEREEGIEVFDLLAEPVRQVRPVPAAPERSQRLTGTSFGLVIEGGKATLLGPGGETLVEPTPSVGRSILARLRRKPRWAVEMPRRVLVYGEPSTPASIIAPLLAGAPRSLAIAIAVSKSGRDVADHVAEIVPDTPAWVLRYLAEEGGVLRAAPLDRSLPLVMPELLRASGFCTPVFGALQQNLSDGDTIDLLVLAVANAAEGCGCEGVALRAVVGLMMPIIGPTSPYGAVPISRDASLDGTFADLVARAR